MNFCGFSKFVAAVAVPCTLAGFARSHSIQERHGIVIANLDCSVKPGDDFYDCANGGAG